jgi:hypothetical protein
VAQRHECFVALAPAPQMTGNEIMLQSNVSDSESYVKIWHQAVTARIQKLDLELFHTCQSMVANLLTEVTGAVSEVDTLLRNFVADCMEGEEAAAADPANVQVCGARGWARGYDRLSVSFWQFPRGLRCTCRAVCRG